MGDSTHPSKETMSTHPASCDRPFVHLVEVTDSDYRRFLGENGGVFIAGTWIRLHRGTVKAILLRHPYPFRLQNTTVWSFPQRGQWATHRGDYRGNWSPHLPRNIVLRYSQPGDTILDQMCGSGTTLVECKLLERNAIGIDINLDAIMLARNRLDFDLPRLGSMSTFRMPYIKTFVGDARHLWTEDHKSIGDEAIDLIAFHPPYFDVIQYSRDQVRGDLSRVSDFREFLEAMRQVATECMRVLRTGRFCAVLAGDIRRGGHLVPLAYRVMQTFLEVGFVLKEDAVKLQWNVGRTSNYLTMPADQRKFLLIMHEHLFIFRKPLPGESTSRLTESMKWW